MDEKKCICSCSVHAASFVKGAEYDENYIDKEYINELYNPLGLSGEYTFSYSYPLSKIAEFQHALTPEMTGEDVLVLARKDYERIYREEEDVAGDPGHIPGMLNRNTSSGPYGIWGHDFSDLYFEGINLIDESKMISFYMGS